MGERDTAGGEESRRRGRRLAAAALAVLVALVVTSPVWRFRLDMGSAFRGIEFLGVSDGEQYVTQLRKILDGHFGRANDLVYEWSRGPQTYRYPAYELYLLPYRLVGGDLHAYVAWTTGICAAVQFLLFAAIARRLGLRRGGAWAVALACCLAPFLWSFHGFERRLFAPERLEIDFLPLFRPMNPSFTSLFLWGGLLVLLRWIEKPSALGLLAVTALAAFGFDIYPALFTMFGGLLAGAACVLLVRRRFRDAALIAAAGAVGVAANLRTLAGVQSMATASAGVVEGNVNAVAFARPILTGDVATLLAVAAVALALNFRKRLSDGALVVAVAAPLALFLQFNQHLVTGRIYQPFHYDWLYSVPFLWLALGVVAPRLLAAPAERLGAKLRDDRTWRAATWSCAAAAALIVVLAFGGRATATALRALGVIRADVVERPVLLAAVGAAAVGAAWCAARLLRGGRTRTAASLLCVVLGAAAVVEGARIQDVGYRRRRADHESFQKIAPAVRWIEANGGKDSVVACGDGALPRLFASYAGCDVYVSLETIFYGRPPEDEYLDRRLLWLALYGVTRDQLAAQLGDSGRRHFDVFKWRTFGPPPRKLAFLSYGVNPAPLPPDAIQSVLAKYDSVLALSPKERLARYRLDYVLFTALDPPQGFRDPGNSYPLTVVLDEPGCRLYRVSPEGR